MSEKWTFKSMLRSVPATADENVVEFPEQRPSLDQLVEQAKSALREQRRIEKERKALDDQTEENRTRLANVQAAIIERLQEIGIEAEP